MVNLYKRSILPPKLKLRDKQTVGNVYMWMQQ